MVDEKRVKFFHDQAMDLAREAYMATDPVKARELNEAAFLNEKQAAELLQEAYELGLRDTENAVTIDVVLAGEYPGDGLPKPVSFPDPAAAAVRGERIALLPLPRLIELKIASGITAPHRLKDLADVLEVIRILELPAGLAGELDPFVRDKYRELWQAAQIEEQE